MRKLVVSHIMNFIVHNHPEYDEVRREEIEYGIVSIYLLISKTIIIGTAAWMLGIFKELLWFIVIYNIVRMPSFGLHATKSWICLLTSSIMFIGIPFLATRITFSLLEKAVLGIIGIVLLYKNSPADTHKKPIISRKRREVYKFLSVMIAIGYSVLAIIVTDTFLSNCFIMAMILQCFITAPLIYKIFGLPYDNYKVYLKEHPELSSQ